jgi:hypothetical protein
MDVELWKGQGRSQKRSPQTSKRGDPEKENPMKPTQVLLILLLAALPCVAQTTNLYDNFNQRFLNQALWFSVCGGFSVTEECSTDVRLGHLHLERGQTGNSDTNSGTNYGQATAFFLNPVPIKSITADIMVLNIDELSCAANPGFGGHAAIIARFFNAGDGTEGDDVGASIIFGRGASNPKGQLYVIGSYFHNGDFSHTVSLGTVQIGTPVTATVAWDESNHRFLFSWTNKLTHVTTPGMLSYSLSNAAPAADPEKHLDVEIFPANCTATPTWVEADALFDNVYTGQ